VDYSQYWVAAGPEISVGEEIIPGLFVDLGPQAVAVQTGLRQGTVAVAAESMLAAPAEVDEGWDVIAETDLESPDGRLRAAGWGGSGYFPFSGPAGLGPGRYRIRVHARHRQQADQGRTAEEHYLLAWPVAVAAPASLLTPLDGYGRRFNGADPPDESPLDDLDLAAAEAVRHLGSLIHQPGPASLSGDLTEVSARVIAVGTPSKVWKLIASPWDWIAIGGDTNPASFHIELSDNPPLQAEGRIAVTEPHSHVAFTWSWTAGSTAEAGIGRRLPAEPGVVDIRLARQGKGLTAVELQYRGVPVELAGQVQSYWDWSLRELNRDLTNAPFLGYPWDR
jgi:hypothetical protein